MSALPRVLLVDDDQSILDALQRALRTGFDCVTSTNVDTALRTLRQQATGFAVVVSDLRMPGADGIALLSAVRRIQPDAVRILLTGFGDADTAEKAVNEGEVFRFLRKPCRSSQVVSAITAAAEQHSLLVAQRELLEGTVHGCVEALADVLALTSPLAFARARRVSDDVGRFAERLGLENRWQLEVAATLSQIGAASLPPVLADKLYFGRDLTDDERMVIDRLSDYAVSVLSHIPRLGQVREILAGMARLRDAASVRHDPGSVPYAAELLRIAFDFDVLITRGLTTEVAFAEMVERADRYDPQLLAEFAAWQGETVRSARTQEVPISELAIGMTLATDIVDDVGVLLVAHGQRVSTRALELVRSYFGADGSRRTVRVRLDDPTYRQDLRRQDELSQVA